MEFSIHPITLAPARSLTRCARGRAVGARRGGGLQPEDAPARRGQDRRAWLDECRRTARRLHAVRRACSRKVRRRHRHRLTERRARCASRIGELVSRSASRWPAVRVRFPAPPTRPRQLLCSGTWLCLPEARPDGPVWMSSMSPGPRSTTLVHAEGLGDPGCPFSGSNGRPLLSRLADCPCWTKFVRQSGNFLTKPYWSCLSMNIDAIL